MQTTDSMTKEERQEYWEMVIEDFSESDLTKTEYCKNNEIAVSTFNYWENKLKELKDQAEGGRFVELRIPDDDASKINVADGCFEPELGIDYRGLRILITSQTPMPLLTNVLGEIGYAQ